MNSVTVFIMKDISIIVAHDLNYGIGINNQLAWHCPQDMSYFKTITSQTMSPSKKNAVLMGRKTWDSIPKKFKPLSSRYNMVLSRQSVSFHDQAYTAHSVDSAIQHFRQLVEKGVCEHLFCIGGGKLYQEMIHHPDIDTLYVTKIMSTFNCDSFFPDYSSHYLLNHESEIIHCNSFSIQFLRFSRK